jgi:hypothetical protein
MYKAYLFIGCMSKIEEYGIWFGEMDSENLSAFHQLFLLVFLLATFWIKQKHFM